MAGVLGRDTSLNVEGIRIELERSHHEILTVMVDRIIAEHRTYSDQADTHHHSYLTPLLSTLLLNLCGLASATWQLGLSCFLIMGGAVLAGGVWKRR
ncbi:MAG: hypothetical protein IGR76_15165 [Synechococcales cyanobacterium T60_A2020_003]|nr:hypothetical protein [Synechococcales cyanobacterium T60_A2020_003]